MATLQSGKCFTVPTFFGMCCRSEWQERMYIYKWHEVDQTKHEIFCVHIVCNEIQVKVNLEITTFFFYLRFPYCPNFFWFGVVCIYQTSIYCKCLCIRMYTKNMYTQGQKFGITVKVFKRNMHVQQGMDSAEVSSHAFCSTSYRCYRLLGLFSLASWSNGSHNRTTSYLLI